MMTALPRVVLLAVFPESWRSGTSRWPPASPFSPRPALTPRPPSNWSITSTLLTLVVPVLYSYLVRDRKPKEASDPSSAPLASGGTGAFMPASKE